MRSKEILAGITAAGVFALGGSTPEAEESDGLRFNHYPGTYGAVAVNCTDGPNRKGAYIDPYALEPQPPMIDTINLGNAVEYDADDRPTSLTHGFTVESQGGGVFEVISSEDRAGDSEVVGLAVKPYAREIELTDEYNLRLSGEMNENGVAYFVITCIDKRLRDYIEPGTPKYPHIRPLPLAPLPVPPEAPRILDV